jgi:hypothetical protein
MLAALPVKPFYEGDTYFGPSAPDDSGWSVVGLRTIPGKEVRVGKESSGRTQDATVLAWKRAAAQQAQAQAPAADPAPAAPQAAAQAQLDASLAANQQAIQQVQSSYAQQSNDMASTVGNLQSLLLKSKEDAAKSLTDQQASFDSYMLKSSSQMDAMRSSYESQLRAATATLPDPERTAVAPRLGDFRTGGRNAAANSLSQLRIIAPSLLGEGLGSVTLGGL